MQWITVFLKRLGIINWLPKSMLLIPSYSGLVTKKKYDLEGLEKKIEQVDKKIPNTNGLLKKIDCSTRIIDIEKNIPSVNRLVNSAVLNTKNADIENTVPDITNLVTKASLNTKAVDVQSKKITGITNLATKASLNKKVTEIGNKIFDTTGFITTSEFNRLTRISLDARIKQEAKSLASKIQVS